MKIKLFALLFISILFAYPTHSQIKNAGCILRMIEPISNELSIEDDSIKISFEFDDLNYFCKIVIENKTSDVLSVDWDGLIMIMEKKSHSIIFDNTAMINKDKPIGKGSIAPKTSLTKYIAPVEYIELAMPLYNKRWIKKHGSQEIGFVIPITSHDIAKNYDCKILVSLD